MGHGRVHNEQLQYRTKSGHIRTGLVSAEIINISNEPCMLVMNNDITQQKLAEEQLRLLSSVTEQVSDATIITDPHFKVTYMNQAAQDLFGYNIEEARGKSLNLFNERPISESALQEILDKISTDKVWRGTTTKKQKNGNIIICDCNMSPLYDEKGQLSFYIDVQRDITRQKEVEAKLQEHKKLIDSILSTMPEGVLVIDSKDRIILANKAFYDIFHIRKTAMKNKTLNEILPADQFFDLHNAVKSGEMENNTLEFRYQAQDLEKIIYSIIVKMDGERTLLTFTDISQEREEEEKLYLTDRLASIGEMAAGLAHELNNPLTGILALSQMLVGSDLPEEHKEDMECIYSEAKRAASIVKNVLLFARNKTDVSGRTSINDVVKDVLRLREYEERSSNIKVVTDLEEDLPEISLDKGQLQQVCLNIISNAEAAIKEVDRPGVITVATQRVNNHVNILLSDNGCGIKKQFMPRIFDPFFTTKEIGKGTGLGLSICYSIIVKHGGKISVKSQVNEGTTFTIRMPIVSPER
jgi:two-component system NtrC family sensor kinase